MREIILTDPFTGIDFKAITCDDHTIIAVHPLTGQTIRMRYDADNASFMLPAIVFDHIETLNFTDAAKELNVTRARVSKAAKDGRIPFKTLPNGSKMILKCDIESYNENKQIGRPRKDA